MQEREDEERKLIAELVNLQHLLVKPRDIPKITEQQPGDWIESIQQALTGEDIDLARQAVRQFVAKIVVHQKTATLLYTFPLSDRSRHGIVTSTGFQPTSGYKHRSVSKWLVKRLYKDFPASTTLASGRKLTLVDRNQIIRDRYTDGETIADLTRDYQISDQRIFQIIHGQRK